MREILKQTERRAPGYQLIVTVPASIEGQQFTVRVESVGPGVYADLSVIAGAGVFIERGEDHERRKRLAEKREPLLFSR